MVFFVNGKKERYNPHNMKKDTMLNEGNEVEAYKIGDDVIKFYKPYCQKRRMDKVTCEKFKEIYTHRIKLPSDIMLDKKHHIRGYKMKYIENLGEDSFYSLGKKELSDEISLIHDDIIKLSDNGVSLYDLNHENTIYNKGIYFIDPGSFTISEQDKKDYIKTYGINIDKINDYLLNDIIRKCALKLCKNRTKAFTVMTTFREDVYSKKNSILDYLINNMEYESLNDLAKTYLKRLNDSIVKVNGKNINFDSKNINGIYKSDDKEMYIIKKDDTEDKVLYLYKKPSLLKMNQREINKLQGIKTNRIMLPSDKGYSKDYIVFSMETKNNHIYYLPEINGEKLVEEINLLKEDADILSENGIELDYLDSDDIIYDGSLYIKNVEKIKFVTDRKNLKQKNIEKINKFILEELIKDNLYQITSFRKANIISDKIENNSNEFIGDTISEELSKASNLRNYTKTLVKTLNK